MDSSWVTITIKLCQYNLLFTFSLHSKRNNNFRGTRILTNMQNSISSLSFHIQKLIGTNETHNLLSFHNLGDRGVEVDFVSTLEVGIGF